MVLLQLVGEEQLGSEMERRWFLQGEEGQLASTVASMKLCCYALKPRVISLGHIYV
jgi:hypothetical protein